MSGAHAFILVALCGVAISCDDGPAEPASTLPAPTFGAATIRGVIHFVGTPPQRAMIDTPNLCYEGASVIQVEDVVVDAAGGLRDVIVYLKDAPKSDGSGQPTLRLDQAGCRYVPHTLAVQIGQPLAISSSDPAFHNVHWATKANAPQNLGFPPRSAPQTVRFDHVETIRVKCDVHQWMEANVRVFDHPFTAVTATNGSFTISRVPVGRYVLEAWHPLLGERSQAIEVTADGTTDVTFDYAPPG